MRYYQQRNVMVVEQIEYTTPESLVPLLKVLYPIILDAFNDTLCTYYGQSSEIGIYISDKSYKPQTDYAPETFFTLVKTNTIINVASTTDINNKDDPDKIVFNHHTCECITGSSYIDKICALECSFRSAIESRAETIKYLRDFEPATAFKWYYTTGYYKKLCRAHCRRLIIDVLKEAIANLSGEKPRDKKLESLV